ncbi:MAG: LysR family transcriptional regulator [Clostridiales Family XIII bacterium]|jgi:DNA-binding transcriptional LysR family regulator|nr:LysR family transcriptional regulator [Clostridiales Family XIII bacterium]
MDISHLKCLLGVLYTGSVTEAGRLVHLSQSSISKKIITLENEMGIKLLERNGKRVILTPSAHRLMTHFVSILESYDHAMITLDEIKRENNGNRQSLKILGIPPIARYNIISLINNFSHMHPEIDVSVEEMESDRIFLMLQYADCDLAFVSDIKVDPERYDMQIVQRERFMIACSPKNPLSKREFVYMKDLRHEKLIFNRPESLLYYPCIEACEKAGFKPNIVLTTSRPTIAFEYLHTDCKYVYMGLRKTLLDEKSPLHCAVPIKDSPEFNFSYVWRKSPGLSESASLFLRHVSAKNKARAGKRVAR